MAIIITMLLMGVLLGFVGAGGAGFIIAILTLVFHIPIHVALATSLTAMAFTTLSGVVSHYTEGNVGWFIWDWFSTLYPTWINSSIRINNSAIYRDDNACYITNRNWRGAWI